MATNNHTTESTTTTSRRNLLAGLAAAPLALALPAAALATTHPDAHILAMGRELTEHIDQINAKPEDVTDEDWARQNELEDAIFASRPQTLAGMAVTLRIIYRTVSGGEDCDEPVDDGNDWHIVKLWQVIRVCEGRA